MSLFSCVRTPADPDRPIHRLDKDTSGVLLLARTDDAMSQISALFANREIDKKYLAVTLGLPNPFKGKLVCKLEKKQVGGKWKFTMADASGRGVEAITKYRVISFNGLHAALVELMPITGRQVLRCDYVGLGSNVIAASTARAVPRAATHLHPWRPCVRPGLHTRCLCQAT